MLSQTFKDLSFTIASKTEQHGKNRIDQVGGFCKRPLTMAIQSGQVDAVNCADDIIKFFKDRPTKSTVKTNYIKLDKDEMTTKFHGSKGYQTLNGISKTFRLDHKAGSYDMQLSKKICSCESFNHAEDCDAGTEDEFQPWLEDVDEDTIEDEEERIEGDDETIVDEEDDDGTDDEDESSDSDCVSSWGSDNDGNTSSLEADVEGD